MKLPFIAAILVLHLSLLVSAQSSAVKTVDFCASFDFSKYNGQVIRTSGVLSVPRAAADLVDGPSPFFYSPKCNDRDHFAVANFSLNEDGSWTKKIESDLTPKSPLLFYSVTVEGKFSVADQPLFGHLNYARAELQVMNVVSIERIKTGVALPDWKADSPIYDAGGSLTDTFAQFMLDLAMNKTSQTGGVDTKAARITIGRKDSSIEEIALLLQKGRVAIDEAGAGAKVFRAGENWMANGTLTLVFKDTSKAVYEFEGEWRDVKGFPWKLISMDVHEKTKLK